MRHTPRVFPHHALLDVLGIGCFRMCARVPGQSCAAETQCRSHVCGMLGWVHQLKLPNGQALIDLNRRSSGWVMCGYIGVVLVGVGGRCRRVRCTVPTRAVEWRGNDRRALQRVHALNDVHSCCCNLYGLFYPVTFVTSHGPLSTGSSILVLACHAQSIVLCTRTDYATE